MPRVHTPFHPILEHQRRNPLARFPPHISSLDLLLTTFIKNVPPGNHRRNQRRADEIKIRLMEDTYEYALSEDDFTPTPGKKVRSSISGSMPFPGWRIA